MFGHDIFGINNRKKDANIKQIEAEEKLSHRNDICELFEKDYFINWLIKFSKKYPNFISETILLDSDQKISKSDINNIYQLSLLYDALYEYSLNQKILPLVVCSKPCFFISVEGYTFCIGSVSGGYFVESKKFEDIKKYINYNDLKNYYNNLLEKSNKTMNIYDKKR